MDRLGLDYLFGLGDLGLGRGSVAAGLLQVTQAEHLTLQGAELAWLLFARLRGAALLNHRGLGSLGLGILSHNSHILCLLGVLAGDLDSLLGRLEILGTELLERQVIVRADALQEDTVTLADQGIAGKGEHGGSHSSARLFVFGELLTLPYVTI